MNSKDAPTDKRPDIILDLDRLKKNCNGNIDIVKELLAHLHQKSRPKWIGALNNAIASGNSEELQGVCHGMKGASATVFAWKISNLALEFEILARHGKVETINSRMAELQDAFEDLAVWMEKHPELS